MGRSTHCVDEQDKKGFTGHEDEEEFGLVNMKGRLLDPKIGRFTTADPVIANVYNGQNFGAYSYVRNNPLTLIDPTGFVDRPAIDVPPEVDMIEQTVITEYPDDFVPEPLSEEIRESTSSLRFTTDVDTTGDGASGLPQDTTDPDDDARNGRSIGELVGAYLFGVGEGLVPFASVGHSLADCFGASDNKSPEARFGLAIGQIVGGVFATIGGIGGEVLGGIATVSGVGAALGVPVMVVSTVAVVGGQYRGGDSRAGVRDERGWDGRRQRLEALA